MKKFYLEKRVKYFEYLSRAKVTMLYEQIDKRIRDRIAFSLRIKTPIVDADARQRETEPNDYDKLRIVLSHLDESNSIGTVDEPLAYFAGELQLCWSHWDKFVYLGGRTETTILGLGGSLHHLTSRLNTPLPAISEGGSRLGPLVRHLRQALSDEYEDIDDTYNDSVVEWAARASALQRGDAEPMEFVARRLARGEGRIRAQNRPVRSDFQDLKDLDGVRVLVGSPLYVAARD